ncbi:LysM peptidoglycan-binding domain-containing protein [Geobacter sp.]|uniref:LysM peptidoglycan-binding domain-containing protein n=1 Tax=Geobacter sp. TaxID=46610 RepID=UPI00260860B9|nr:LysM peptidoglycan-binding domain-containing protein [Geobacter sp.]
MNNAIRVVASSLVLSLLAPPFLGAEEYLLYTPEPSEGKRPADPDEGVLVKRITIRRGDTLYALSRKYGGKGGYYPQILLFNLIKNPDLIYAGNKLLVPLPSERKGEGAVRRAKRKRACQAAALRREERGAKGKTPAPAVKERAKEPLPPAPGPKVGGGTPEPSQKPAVEALRPAPVSPKRGEENEQTLFEAGVSAYKTGAYQQSIDAFDRFLARYPSSPLVPDATLYRADALLKLAGQ